ncbi:hypothetical protein BGZ49_006149, partial [Haplosporangium sp. Z 27]
FCRVLHQISRVNLHIFEVVLQVLVISVDNILRSLRSNIAEDRILSVHGSERKQHSLDESQDSVLLNVVFLTGDFAQLALQSSGASSKSIFESGSEEDTLEPAKPGSIVFI